MLIFSLFDERGLLMKKYIILLVLLITSCTQFNKFNKLYKAADYDNAIIELNKIIQSDSLNYSAYHKLGKCYLAKEKINPAMQAFKKAYELGKNSNNSTMLKQSFLNSRIMLGDSLVNTKDLYKARQEYLYAFELDTSNTTCLKKLGDLYYNMGRLDDSKTFYERLITQIPSDTHSLGKLDSIQVRSELSTVELQKGINLFEAYNYSKSLEHFEKSLSYKQDNIDSKYYQSLTNGAILYNKGSKKQLWDSIEHFGKAMMYRPNSGEPHFYMGMAYEKKDRREFDSAIEQYKLAIQKEPDGYFNNYCQKKIRELTTLRDRLNKFWKK